MARHAGWKGLSEHRSIVEFSLRFTLIAKNAADMIYKHK